MVDFSGYEKRFIQLSRAWYAPDNLSDSMTDAITFGYYEESSESTAGEMTIQWDGFGAQLRVGDYAFAALATFGDVLAGLGSPLCQPVTPCKVRALLLHCGFRDATPIETPTASPCP